MTCRHGSGNWTGSGARIFAGFNWPRGRSKRWSMKPPRRESVSRSRRGREGAVMADDPSANREAELLALRIVETLEAAGALDVRKLNDRTWNEVCHICGGERLPVNERQARHDGAQGRNRTPEDE